MSYIKQENSTYITRTTKYWIYLHSLSLGKLKTEGQTVHTENLAEKLQNSNQNPR